MKSFGLTVSVSVAAILFAACGGTDQALETADSADALRTTQVDRANAPIPDDDPRGITRTLDVDNHGAAITRVRVVVQIRHSYRGDLRVVLRSPTGTSAVLHDQTGGSRNNLRIDTVLTSFAGESGSGTWHLGVSDLAASDVGVLQAWGLTVEDDQGSGTEGARCAASSDCRNDLYCGTDGTCRADGSCGEVADCGADGNAWVHILCAGYPTCGASGQCGWQCGPPADPCASVRCAAGTHCEVVQVECIRAPCPPLAQCVPDAPPQGAFCGSRGSQVYCQAGEYCHHEVGQICGWADAQGECRPVPEACYEIYRPVCGCDNVTYPNDCYAHAAGTSVQREGECAPPAYWDTKGASFGTRDPYGNNEVLTETFYAPPDAQRARLTFDRFDLESNYDFVWIVDATGREVARWTGRLGGFEPEFDFAGSTFTVHFASDYSVVRSGFHVSAVSWYRVP